MEVKNLQYVKDGSIDMDINHPEFGWIPFTASSTGASSLYTSALAGEYGEILEYIDVPDPVAIDLNTLTVMSSNGNIFDADVESRQNMGDVLKASEILGITETTWRLADNTEILIGVSELEQVFILSLNKYASAKGIGN